MKASEQLVEFVPSVWFKLWETCDGLCSAPPRGETENKFKVAALDVQASIEASQVKKMTNVHMHVKKDPK